MKSLKHNTYNTLPDEFIVKHINHKLAYIDIINAINEPSYSEEAIHFLYKNEFELLKKVVCYSYKSLTYALYSQTIVDMLKKYVLTHCDPNFILTNKYNKYIIINADFNWVKFLKLKNQIDLNYFKFETIESFFNLVNHCKTLSNEELAHVGKVFPIYPYFSTNKNIHWHNPSKFLYLKTSDFIIDYNKTIYIFENVLDLTAIISILSDKLNGEEFEVAVKKYSTIKSKHDLPIAGCSDAMITIRDDKITMIDYFNHINDDKYEYEYPLYTKNVEPQIAYKLENEKLTTEFIQYLKTINKLFEIFETINMEGSLVELKN